MTRRMIKRSIICKGEVYSSAKLSLCVRSKSKNSLLIGISINKLRKIKKGAEGSRVPWIILLVVCGIYVAFVIAAIVFLFILSASIAVNGM